MSEYIPYPEIGPFDPLAVGSKDVKLIGYDFAHFYLHQAIGYFLWHITWYFEHDEFRCQR